MATVPAPNTTPEAPPEPGNPGEIVPPSPDRDVPDPNPADPGKPVETPAPI